MAVYVTTQIAPVDANAGLQQNISVSSPSTLDLDGDLANGVPAGQNGPGWATVSGGASASAPAPGTTTTTIDGVSWTTWLVVAALAWFGFKKLGRA